VSEAKIVLHFKFPRSALKILLKEGYDLFICYVKTSRGNSWLCK